MTWDYSFSCSGIRPSFTSLKPDSLSMSKNLSLKTQHQLMPEHTVHQQTPSFSYSYDSQPLSQSDSWLMFQGHNYNSNPTGLLRKGQGHQRNASESTINSTGPSSPFMQTSSFPYIANADQSPTASYYSDNDQTLNNVGYVPSKLSHTPAAHFAMQSMATDHHNSTFNDDNLPEFSHSSRHSVSSRGQDSPSTPQPRSSVDREERPGLFKVPTNDFKTVGPRVELNRTESAAFADELFNPHNTDNTSLPPPPPSASHNNLLSPHQNLVDERLRTANSIRSQSPAGSMSRERSPFRQGSPYAPPASNFKSPVPFLATAADSRRQQREEASAREWASHQPKLRRELTKTMSPKDALLDFNDPEGADMPLFSDAPPSGYNFASNMAAPQQNIGGFRASTDQSSIASTNFNFIQPQAPASMPANPYAPAAYRPANFGTEATPDFPAHLTSMESSVSEGPTASSQGSMGAVTSIPRPHDTTAHTGSYACAIQGCTQRFETPAKLQKHKREAHASNRDSLSSTATAASSPGSARSTSPDGIGSQMTAAALAERNSQQGPHKCTRINPSTGKPCNTIFSRPYDLTRHEDTIHNRVKQKVRCQYCREEKTFSRADALTRHMRVVHPEVDFHGRRGRKGDHF